MVKYIKWLKIIIGVFVGIHLIVFFALIFQEQIIFQSKSVSEDYKFKILVPHQEYIWQDTSSKREIFNAIYTPAKKANAGYIFYLHGNYQNVEYHTQFIPFYTDLGYTVWMMDYIDFGKTTGERTEKNLYEDASMMLDSFASKYDIKIQDIVIVGVEFGAAIATRLANNNNIKKLALITPFSNLAQLYREYIPLFPFKLLLNYRFDTQTILSHYKGQVAIFYGSNNMFVPLRNTNRLQKVLKPGDEFHFYNTKHFDNVSDNTDFQHDMNLFLKK
ncbi:MAG: alpha/beta hydrolase [Chitinophagales bacterium]|nr:alpha/beta hydrolase [Chitinophagales bacterium]